MGRSSGAARRKKKRQQRAEAPPLVQAPTPAVPPLGEQLMYQGRPVTLDEYKDLMQTLAATYSASIVGTVVTHHVGAFQTTWGCDDKEGTFTTEHTFTTEQRLEPVFAPLEKTKQM